MLQIPHIKISDTFFGGKQTKEALNELLVRVAEAHAEEFPLAERLTWYDLS